MSFVPGIMHYLLDVIDTRISQRKTTQEHAALAVTLRMNGNQPLVQNRVILPMRKSAELDNFSHYTPLNHGISW